MLPSTDTSLRHEIRALTRLSVPVVGAQVGTMAMGLVDTAMLGRVSVEALAASSIANAWLFFTLLFCNGLLLGMDPIVSQAHGRGDGRSAAIALQRGLVLSCVLGVGVGALWTGTESVMGWLRQSPDLAARAHAYVVVQIPSVPFFLAFAALRSQLQGREIMRPAMWATLVANVSNALLNWVLIFGHLGLPALGLEGAGIATSINRVLMLAVLVLLVRRLDLMRGAWVPWSGEAWRPAGLLHLLRIGLPIGLQMGLELLAFSAATLLAGALGAVAVAAHQVAFNFAAFSFMMPMGISQAAATRVGNLLGAGRPDGAQRAAGVALGMGGAVMAVWGAVFVVGRHVLPRLLTSEAEVVALAAVVLPIGAAFQVFDGLQVVGCGVLRGTGRTRAVVWFNLVAYWGLGLPIGAWLALRGGFGLVGIWWGLCLGLGTVAVALVLWIRARGPSHDPRGVRRAIG